MGSRNHRATRFDALGSLRTPVRARQRHHRSRGANGITLIELLLTIAIITLLLQLLLPAVQHSRESSRMAACQNQARNIALALQMHADARGSLPPGSQLSGYIGAQGWNWGYARQILPMVEETDRVAHLRKSDTRPCVTVLQDLESQGLAHPNTTAISLFSCPSDSNAGRRKASPTLGTHYPGSYLGVSGTSLPASSNRQLDGEGLLFSESKIAFRHIQDGVSKTLLIGERAVPPDLSQGWLICGGSYYEQYLSTFRGLSFAGNHEEFGNYGYTGPIDDPGVPVIMFFSSWHRNGVTFAFADAHVEQLDYHIDRRLLNSLATRSHGD